MKVVGVRMSSNTKLHKVFERDNTSPVYISIKNYSSLQVGDHIVQPCAFGIADLLHHAIYIGNKKVLHYYGDPYIHQHLFEKDQSSIRIDDIRLLEKVPGTDHKLQLYVHKHTTPTYKGDEVVSRIMKRLGESEYNLLYNNCEHLVYWALYNIPFSYQVSVAMV